MITDFNNSELQEETVDILKKPFRNPLDTVRSEDRNQNVGKGCVCGVCVVWTDDEWYHEFKDVKRPNGLVNDEKDKVKGFYTTVEDRSFSMTMCTHKLDDSN